MRRLLSAAEGQRKFRPFLGKVLCAENPAQSDDQPPSLPAKGATSSDSTVDRVLRGRDRLR